MDYRLLCRNDAERMAFDKLEQSVNCDYAKYHDLYRQGAQYAFDVFKDMLLNRRNS